MKSLRIRPKAMYHWMTALFFLAGCLFVSGQVHAADDNSFTIFPIEKVENSTGYYQDQIKGGETKEYTFYVKNKTKKPITLSVYPADALPSENGGKSFSYKGETLKNVGTWIAPQGPVVLKLKGNEVKKLKYKVKVPKNLPDGQFVGVVAAEEVTKSAQELKTDQDQSATLAIDVVKRADVQIVLEKNKQNAKHDMVIDSFQHDYISPGNPKLTIKLKNTGTILEKPTGKIIVKNSKGENVFFQEYKADSIYESTTADMVYLVQDKFLVADIYSVYYEATFSGKTISKTFKFTVSEIEAASSKEALQHSGLMGSGKTFWDWISENKWVIYVFIIFIILLLLLLLFFILLWLRRKKKEEEEAEERRRRFKERNAGVTSGESNTSLTT